MNKNLRKQNIQVMNNLIKAPLNHYFAFLHRDPVASLNNIHVPAHNIKLIYGLL